MKPTNSMVELEFKHLDSIILVAQMPKESGINKMVQGNSELLKKLNQVRHRVISQSHLLPDSVRPKPLHILV